jgi:hypothetical protein
MELKDILEFTGLSESATIDDFKAKFDERFVARDIAIKDPKLKTHFQGSIMGGQLTALKRMLSDQELDLESEEFEAVKGKNEDWIKLAIQKVSEKKNAEIEELKTKVGSTNDELIKQKEAELEKLRNKLKDTEGLLKTTAAERLAEQQQFQTKFKEKEISIYLSKAKEGVKLKPVLKDIEKLGFEAEISKRLKFDLDEDGNFFVANEKGERIPNKAKAGTFLNPTEALQALANEHGLIELNPSGGKPAPSGQPSPAGAGQKPPAPSGQPATGGNGIRIHPNAMKAAEGQ